MAKEQEEVRANPESPTKEYKHPVLYLRKSKKGEHLFAFNVEVKDIEGELTGESVLGGGVESLIANLGEVEQVIDGGRKWCKISVITETTKEEGE